MKSGRGITLRPWIRPLLWPNPIQGALVSSDLQTEAACRRDADAADTRRPAEIHQARGVELGRRVVEELRSASTIQAARLGEQTLLVFRSLDFLSFMDVVHGTIYASSAGSATAFRAIRSVVCLGKFSQIDRPQSNTHLEASQSGGARLRIKVPNPPQCVKGESSWPRLVKS